MAKDPAILFYTSDFLTGVADMSDAEVGQYIRLLCLAHQRGGYLKEATMQRICDMNPLILDKFDTTEDGRYYNRRMMEEIDRRKTYTSSRLENLKGKKSTQKTAKKPHMGRHVEDHMGDHMETETEIEIENRNKKGIVKGKPKHQADLLAAIQDKLNEKHSPLAKDPDVADAVTDFVDYRVRSWPNKPFTNKAAQLMATTLIRHSMNRADAAVKIIERSIEMGWLGLFELPAPQMQALMAPNQAAGGEGPNKKKVPYSGQKGRQTIPENYGVPNPKAVPMPEHLKQRIKKIGYDSD